MKKKILALLIIATMIICSLTLISCNKDKETDGAKEFIYVYDDNTDSYSVVGINSLISLDIVFPNTINGKKVTSISGPNLFEVKNKNYASRIKSITIPNSVTSIGSNVFYGCSSLESIEIPNGVTSIGDYAFSCSGLESITIPNSVTSIGFRAFDNCKNLTSFNYQGTKEQWSSVSKASSWNESSSIRTIHCTDGDARP